jgi:dihydrofolate synthase / folylpolyglutamate synthase
VVARIAARGTRVPVTTAGDVRSALAAARAAAGPDGLVCVAGSLALAADARTALGLVPSERWW